MTITMKEFMKDFLRIGKEYAIKRSTKELFAYSILENGRVSIIETMKYKKNKKKLEKEAEKFINKLNLSGKS
jgi:hypothetical protein